MGYKGELPATHYGTVDVHLDVGPGVVYWIAPKATTDHGELIIRDGSDTSAEVLISLEVQNRRTRLFHFNPPLPYERGLFIQLADHIATFTIAYDHLEPKE